MFLQNPIFDNNKLNVIQLVEVSFVSNFLIISIPRKCITGNWTTIIQLEQLHAKLRAIESAISLMY